MLTNAAVVYLRICQKFHADAPGLPFHHTGFENVVRVSSTIRNITGRATRQ